MSDLIHSYAPRPQFIEFHSRSARWAILVCHRRAGKTVAAINDLIAKALHTEKPHARYAYIAPLYGQAKSIAWDYLVQFTTGLRTYMNVSELTVELYNGSRIRLFGGDNPDALRGIYLDGVVLDEPAQMKPRLWTEILLPLLSDRKGFAVFIGTPAGKNSFFEMVQYAQARPDEWFSMVMRASDSGIIDDEELARLREQMDEDEFNQEFECSFDAAIKGSYYGKVVNEMDADGRLLDDIPTDPTKPTHCALDLGFRDDTAGWLWQLTPGGVNYLRAFSVSGFAIPDIHALLLEHGFNGVLWLPHDAMARSLQTGRSVMEQFVSLGHRPRLVPPLGLQDGIQAVRNVLSHKGTRISKTGCEEGIEATRQYQRKWNEKSGAFSQAPDHNWASHYADGLRYSALAIRPPKTKAPTMAPVVSPARGIEVPKLTLDALWGTQPRGSLYERL